MKEIQNILSAFKTLASTGERGVLVTVVHTLGSTYRRPGARALILPEGRMVGHLGGCLLPVILDEAHDVLKTGRPKRLRYEKNTENDRIWMGEPGVVDLFLERVDRDNPGALGFIEKCRTQRHCGVSATVVRAENADTIPLGARWMWCPNKEAETTEGWQPGTSLCETAKRVLADGKSSLLCEASTEILVERISPPLRLLIFGSGADTVPVARIAFELGWSVEVIDREHEEAGKERSPVDCGLKPSHPRQSAIKDVVTDSFTAALLMTHDYAKDRDLLRFLCPSSVRYIGLLGPKRRTERLFETLQNERPKLPEDAFEKCYGPAGFDIGAESPEAIALSIVSEIQAVFNGRKGAALRDRSGPIHGKTS